MSPKHIISLGFDFPAGDKLNIEEVSFNSSKSLCDADTIILQPSTLDLYRKKIYSHLGKSLLDEEDSVLYLEDLKHWRQELNIVLENGKNIFIFLNQIEYFYIYEIGELGDYISHDISCNYDVLPIIIDNLESKNGHQIKIAQNLELLSTYWRNFSQYSKYKVYFELDQKTTFFKTKTGDRAVGAIIPVKKGNLILLPYLEFDTELKIEDCGELFWTEEAVELGRKLKASFIEIDKALRSSGQNSTPPPEWSQQPVYKLKSELELEKTIAKTKSKIGELQQKLELDQAELEKQGHLKWLLYEKGKPLEAAIIEALKILGFSAKNYKNDESEFDAVFVSEEGRFIGEAEGKDNKAIKVDKFSQLEREVQEDFAREEVTEYAKGVLFGNAYRLKELEQRKDFFTQKCLSGAKRSGIALIKTPDLFTVAKYLKENNDPDFAQLCRQAIANTEGEIVEFPVIPVSNVLKAD